MNLILLQTYFQNKVIPSLEELTDHINRYYPHWSVSKTEIKNYHNILEITAKAPRPNTYRGRETPAEAPKASVKRRSGAWLFAE